MGRCVLLLVQHDKCIRIYLAPAALCSDQQTLHTARQFWLKLFHLKVVLLCRLLAALLGGVGFCWLRVVYCDVAAPMYLLQLVHWGAASSVSDAPDALKWGTWCIEEHLMHLVHLNAASGLPNAPGTLRCSVKCTWCTWYIEVRWQVYLQRMVHWGEAMMYLIHFCIEVLHQVYLLHLMHWGASPSLPATPVIEMLHQVYLLHLMHRGAVSRVPVARGALRYIKCTWYTEVVLQMNLMHFWWFTERCIRFFRTCARG